MSIEALIKAHTEALLENTAAVKNLTLSLAGRTPSKAENKVEDASKAGKTETKKEEPKTEVKEEPKTEVIKPDAGEIRKKDNQSATPYETVRALLLKLAPTNRDGVKAVLTSAGIANLKVLLDKEDDFTTVNDQAKLEAVYTDLQSLEA